MIVHCGDYYNDAMAIRRYSGVPVTAVKGKCDNEFSENGYAVLSTEAGDLLITHGHMENVGSSLQRLFYKTLEYLSLIHIFTFRLDASFLQDLGKVDYSVVCIGEYFVSAEVAGTAVKSGHLRSRNYFCGL